MKARILKEVSEELNLPKRVEVLLKLLKENKIEIPEGISTETIRAFLRQCQHDASVSPSMIESWERQLKASLDVPSRKYEHAHLFGRLAMEWVKDGSQETPSEEQNDKFETVGRKEMVEQRTEWEKLVFNPPANTDPAAIEAYLKGLFETSTESQRGLKLIRKSFKDPDSSTEWEYKVPPFDSEGIKVCIAHLLTGDTLSPAKQAALKDLRDNKLVLAEIADVLNMELDNLQTWSWGSQPIDLDIRRSLNGRYRVFMDEELLQAIFLQYVGVQWAIKLKETLTNFLNSGAWKESTMKHGKAPSHSRYKHQPNTTVKHRRFETFKSEYFMQQLPTSFTRSIPSYDDHGDNDSLSSEGGKKKKAKSAGQKKQELFRLITTEAILTSHLHGNFTVLQSDFKWFGPSLPHTTIMTVMKFFGVPKFWLDFFEKYLQPPLRFLQDGPDAQTFVRKSGVPISHALTDVLGEAVLFCLDYAVNVNAHGNLYRIHDDIWFWGSQEATTKAWRTLQQFTDVMGMNLNEEKTGSAIITYGEDVNAKTSSELPKGDLKWGFLSLQSDGIWSLDDKKIDEHTAELKIQLSACRSIFYFVQAWNSYVGRFLANNLGEPAECLGRSHIEMSKSTFKKIQEALFASTTNDEAGQPPTQTNVAEYLKTKIRNEYSIPPSSLPDGILFFPHTLGGLALHNPIIALSLLDTNAWKPPHTIIQDALDSEEIDYHRAVTDYDKGLIDSPLVQQYLRKDASHEDLISFEEAIGNVEARSAHLHDAYVRLMARPRKEGVSLGRVVKGALEEVEWTRGDERAEGDEWRWEAYWRWVVGLYGEEVVERFGGLAMAERRLLPLGLTGMMRAQRVRWLG